MFFVFQKVIQAWYNMRVSELGQNVTLLGQTILLKGTFWHFFSKQSLPASTSTDWESISMFSLLDAALQKSSSTHCTVSVTLYGTGLFNVILLFTTTLPFLKFRISNSLNPVRLDWRYGRSCGGSRDRSQTSEFGLLFHHCWLVQTG